MKIRRLINCYIPVSVCNLTCRYCYVPQFEGRKKNAMPNWALTPVDIGKALSNRRLGGPCVMNICGDGETLIHAEVPEIIRELLLQGHVIELVTNGLLTNRINEILTFDASLLSRLEFKFSYHYEQLKERGLLETFWNNVYAIKQKGCSFTIELTPHDELIPLIDEIKEDCLTHVGALCHVTTTFDYSKNMILNTNLTKDEYERIWGQFDSPMFKFKMSVLGEKRNEYCYAGEFLMSVDLASGLAHQCYCGKSQNIYKNIDKPIKWNAIGHHCEYPMCFNAHALLVFGAIPMIAKNIFYSDIRNRICEDGTEWLQKPVKQAFDSKFIDMNREYSFSQKVLNEIQVGIQVFFQKVRSKLKNER